MPPHTGETTRHQPPVAGARPSRVVAAALVTLGLLLGLTAPAAAQTAAPASPTAAELRAQADRIGSQYFATLASFAQADAAVRDNETEVADLRGKAAVAKAAARERALLAYKSSGSGLSAVIAGDTTAEAARRVKLVDTVNARDRSAYKSFRATARALKAKQQALRDARKAQEQALADLKAQGTALDAKLAEAQQREQAAAAAQAQAQQAQAQPQARTAAAAASTTTTAPPTPTTIPAAPTPPSHYSGTPGTSPHHDDPFLSCVRARESGGNYAVVNPAGPYLGAYQFLQSTWNGAASHAGRSDLVGVPANTASPFDQDEVAWALYQWQGTGPWGGHCP